MFKAVILLTRRVDMSHDDFRRWWLEDHAPLARQLPGCRRLVFNVVEPVDPAAASTARQTTAQTAEQGQPDGISELWFDSRQAFDAAYATELGRAVAADSAAHVSARVRLFVDEVEQLA